MEQEPRGEDTSEDDEIRALVTRLSRPHRTGGRVVERASLLAAGNDFAAVIAWIEAHGGEPEAPPAAKTQRGLHSSRLAPRDDAAPLRFILPAAACA
ncbi:MAG TPA: hypothetical protein VGW10_14960 [Solirubrobacteraceae bacterium]|nr:hypothetical protein [Solirubrobacteraceae bacterium]